MTAPLSTKAGHPPLPCIVCGESRHVIVRRDTFGVCRLETPTIDFGVFPSVESGFASV
jgi:hypothetical protein